MPPSLLIRAARSEPGVYCGWIWVMVSLPPGFSA